MGYRIIADEHIEFETRRSLRGLNHDIEWIGDVAELGRHASDRSIAAYSLAEDRLVLTQDDDFLTTIDPSESAGILFQRDQTLTSRHVAAIVTEMSRHLPQSAVTLEYVGRRWL